MRRGRDQIANECERGKRNCDRDTDRCCDQERVVEDVSAQAHTRHAEVVHAGHRQSNADAGEDQKRRAYPLSIKDYKRDCAADNCRGGRGDDEDDVEPDEDRQVKSENADEMHAPDAESQNQRADAGPEKAPAALGGANALRDLNRDVGSESGDND